MQHIFRLSGQHPGRNITTGSAHQGGGSGHRHVSKFVRLVVPPARGQDNGLQRPGLWLSDMDLILLQPGVARMKAFAEKALIDQFRDADGRPGAGRGLRQQGILMPVHILPGRPRHRRHVIGHYALLRGRMAAFPPAEKSRHHDDQDNDRADCAEQMHQSTSVTLTR